MTDQQRHIRPGTRRFDRGSLRGQIDRAAAVGIRDQCRQTLREERLSLVQVGQEKSVERV